MPPSKQWHVGGRDTEARKLIYNCVLGANARVNAKAATSAAAAVFSVAAAAIRVQKHSLKLLCGNPVIGKSCNFWGKHGVNKVYVEPNEQNKKFFL